MADWYMLNVHPLTLRIQDRLDVLTKRANELCAALSPIQEEQRSLQQIVSKLNDCKAWSGHLDVLAQSSDDCWAQKPAIQPSSPDDILEILPE